MKLDIPDVPPSLNRTLRLHWRDRRTLYNDWMKLVRSARIPPTELINAKRRLKITLHHSRKYDKDNAYGSVKPIVDALNYWNYIYDDNEAWVELIVEQEKCPHKKRHTVIEHLAGASHAE